MPPAQPRPLWQQLQPAILLPMPPRPPAWTGEPQPRLHEAGAASEGRKGLREARKQRNQPREKADAERTTATNDDLPLALAEVPPTGSSMTVPEAETGSIPAKHSARMVGSCPLAGEPGLGP